MTAAFNGSTGNDYIYTPPPADTSSAPRTGTIVIPAKDMGDTSATAPATTSTSSQPNLVHTIAKLIDTPATAIADVITAAPAPAPEPVSASTATAAIAPTSTPEPVSQTSISIVGGSASKTLATEDTAPATTAVDEAADSQRKLLLLAAVAAAGVGLYYMAQQKKR
jgi:hypothetical protein